VHPPSADASAGCIGGKGGQAAAAGLFLDPNVVAPDGPDGGAQNPSGSR